MDIARTAHRCSVDRATALADLAPVSVRSGQGWLAIRSGAASNDLNVVLSEVGFLPQSRLVEELAGWFGGVPASWLTTEPAESLTRALTHAGWMPERTGRWCGRAVGPTRPALDAVEVNALASQGDLDDWLGIAASCGWYETLADHDVRRDLMRAMMGDRRHAALVARLDGQPVGMVAGWCDGVAVEVVGVAVRAEARRRGVGAALVSQVMTWGAGRGAREVVAAPSPDGWRLLGSLGFEDVAVVPDTCFYLPGGASPAQHIV